MKSVESELLEKWLLDPSFANWATKNNAEDIQKWESYLVAHPAHREVAEIGKFAILQLKSKTIDIEEGQGKIALKRLKQKLSSEKPLPHQSINRHLISRKWPIAAAILVLVAIGSWWFGLNFSPKSTMVVSTDYGETKQLLLEDQSKVTLNAYSTLKYDKHRPRQVWLDGEAFFEVSKKGNAEEQFQVFTSDLTVKVLGTIFNVNSRNEQTEVFLEEGKVLLALEAAEAKELEMSPGELISYSKKQQKILANQKAKALEHTSWLKGIIRFKEATLTEALVEISNIYGITFDTTNVGVNESLFTGGVPSKDVMIALQTIEEVYGLKIERIKDVYHIYIQVENE